MAIDVNVYVWTGWYELIRVEKWNECMWIMSVWCRCYDSITLCCFLCKRNIFSWNSHWILFKEYVISASILVSQVTICVISLEWNRVKELPLRNRKSILKELWSLCLMASNWCNLTSHGYAVISLGNLSKCPYPLLTLTNSFKIHGKINFDRCLH